MTSISVLNARVECGKRKESYRHFYAPAYLMWNKSFQENEQ